MEVKLINLAERMIDLLQKFDSDLQVVCGTGHYETDELVAQLASELEILKATEH